MTTKTKIQKQQQLIAHCEKSLALEKLKKRRADTRRKIELGGLVIKSGMDVYTKSIILGVLNYSFQKIKTNEDKSFYEEIGVKLF
ncbi:conjugal transfer protein TraD [Legionella taurinensis]|uniref:Conjugal transfer protein TraD n=1 Tax=Legionella taurinensis TaxID=70611 RepID=A0AB38N0H3_9GAMM|nr:conjugal transfer protein TraD [Legionella taurinensis]MDX1838844.1 conjugal transfer protein TraD [Legionella taurinensis]PUT38577.1 conjugal transfer protein TraD [Legionella taurinensis]PUT39342.1 conjugal transfer protein TraD [Legionella taurinensis]PUT41614.1 conjugal transfer protein TraD [Legionella taurinensis]PUT44649.1 conjugal transfer protein TraD [Legionella taurinensis]